MEGDKNFIQFESSDSEPGSRETAPENVFVKKNGPWTKGKTYDHPSILLRIHEELIDFYHYMHATKEEHAQRLVVIDRIRRFSQEIWPKCVVCPYGSFTTDLYLPSR